MESPCFSRPQSTASHLFARTRSFHRPTYKRPAPVVAPPAPADAAGVNNAQNANDNVVPALQPAVPEVSVFLVLVFV